MKALRIISRLIVGLTFMFSGFVKGVDPMGLTYKFTEYLEVYNMEWLIPSVLYLAIILCAIEFAVGAALVFNLKPKIATWASLVLMVGFTTLTLLSAINNPVSDCGCFGDAIKLTNWETFYKNVVLLVLVIVILLTRYFSKPSLNFKLQLVFLIVAILFPLFISVYSYRHLPLIDFLPWKEGNKISEQIVATPEKAKIFLIYKNKKTGEVKEYPSDNFPWQDTVWVANWEFQDQRKEIIQPYKQAPIHDFIIMDESGNDLTPSIIGNQGYQFIIVAHNLRETHKESFLKINEFQKLCEKDSFSFVGLTGSGKNDVDDFRHEAQTQFPIYSMDETALKTMIRSNPGLVLLHNGTVVRKWHYNDFPTYSKTKEKYLK